MTSRATRSKAAVKTPRAKDGAASKNGRKRRAPTENSDGEEEDAYQDEHSVSEAESLDSDALDEDEDVKPTSRKRKRAAPAGKKSPAKTSKNASPKKAGASARKKRKTKAEETEDEDDFELEEGQEVVGVVVQAPKTGRGGLHSPIRCHSRD